MKKFEKELKQFTQMFGRNGSFLSNVQALASHTDKSAWLEAQVRQLLQRVNQQQSRLDLRSLVDTVDSVRQRITLLEASDQRLGMCSKQSLPSGPPRLHAFVTACILLVK